MILEIDHDRFYRDFDVCPAGYKQKFISDTHQVIDEGYDAKDVPPLQTLNAVYQEKMQGIHHWDYLVNFIQEKISEYTGKESELLYSWINISMENNSYNMHTHNDVDLTCVYYLKGNFFEYGTNINNKIIIPFIENSLLMFDGKIQHSIVNMPKQLASQEENHRYSMVFDFKMKEANNEG